ncbi:cytochrome c oxidase assembly protein [Microvirga arabica]|uniref:cytochrome c oxidase assembly protein n=2 Tax=Microvirga arabica TaxID=1128671 RepID=UPI00193AAEBA|nr:cytochrome c oxidase assembly protein [Microvirga arabica]MBM1170018.1 cytochrome c oxidase assembly protein [Microvirga arabica]
MMRPLVSAVLMIFLSIPAFAHESAQPIEPSNVWHHWSAEPWVLVSLPLAFVLYGVGVRNLWRHAGLGRGISIARVASYAGGGAILIVALVSPLDSLSGTLLAAHMVQHVLLIGVAPPLLLAGLPGGALPWFLPKTTRRALGRSSGVRVFAEWTAFLIRPLPACALHGAALWLWHAPAPFEAALRNEAVHAFEHVTFFATAMLFWHSLAASLRSTATVPAGIAAGFLTLVYGGFLGALITFSPTLLYPWYQRGPEQWGLDPLADQQLAGLIMWVPASFIYLLACLALAARLLISSGRYRFPAHQSS